MTKYEKALREFNGLSRGTIKWPKGTKKGMLLAKQKLEGCSCAVGWWRIGTYHLGNERHIALKYKIPLATMRLLINLSRRGHTHITEFCKYIDNYENLTGSPLTETRALDLIASLEGGNDAA